MLKLIINKIKYLINPRVSIFSAIKGHCKINKYARINRFVRFYNSKIGRYSYIGPASLIDHTIIGNFCSISWNCNIGIASHNISLLSTSPIFLELKNGTGSSWVENRPLNTLTNVTSIGNDVWIGANVIVMQGVNIGDGAVVGAGSIVTKDVPSFSVVAGVPAKFIKWRFTPDLISLLLERKWWYAPDEIIKEKIKIFQKSTISIEDASEIPNFKD